MQQQQRSDWRSGRVSADALHAPYPMHAPLPPHAARSTHAHHQSDLTAAPALASAQVYTGPAYTGAGMQAAGVPMSHAAVHTVPLAQLQAHACQEAAALESSAADISLIRHVQQHNSEVQQRQQQQRQFHAQQHNSEFQQCQKQQQEQVYQRNAQWLDNVFAAP